MGERQLTAQWARDSEAVAQRIGAFVPRRESRTRVERFLHVAVAPGIAMADRSRRP